MKVDIQGIERSENKRLLVMLAVKIKVNGGLNLSVLSNLAINCSEVAARLIRAGKNEFLPNMKVDVITPYDFAKGLGVLLKGLIT